MASTAVSLKSKKARQADARSAFIAKMGINMAVTMRELTQSVRSALAIGIVLKYTDRQADGQKLLRLTRNRLSRLQARP